MCMVSFGDYGAVQTQKASLCMSSQAMPMLFSLKAQQDVHCLLASSKEKQTYTARDKGRACRSVAVHKSFSWK